jgi:hypothetical protein
MLRFLRLRRKEQFERLSVPHADSGFGSPQEAGAVRTERNIRDAFGDFEAVGAAGSHVPNPDHSASGGGDARATVAYRQMLNGFAGRGHLAVAPSGLRVPNVDRSIIRA